MTMMMMRRRRTVRRDEKGEDCLKTKRNQLMRILTTKVCSQTLACYKSYFPFWVKY